MQLSLEFCYGILVSSSITLPKKILHRGLQQDPAESCSVDVSLGAEW